MKFESRNGITRLVIPTPSVSFSMADIGSQRRHVKQGHTLTNSKQYALCSCGRQWTGTLTRA